MTLTYGQISAVWSLLAGTATIRFRQTQNETGIHIEALTTNPKP